jgi:hypothetical protein
MTDIERLTQIENTLEAIIDSGIRPDQIVESLAIIANAKAQHVLENWQDKPACRAWEQMALKLNSASFILEKQWRRNSPF